MFLTMLGILAIFQVNGVIYCDIRIVIIFLLVYPQFLSMVFRIIKTQTWYKELYKVTSRST